MAVCQLPQIVKVVRTHNVNGISLWMQVLLGMGMLFWLITGILYESIPMVASNGCCLVFCVTIILFIMKDRYNRQRNKKRNRKS